MPRPSSKSQNKSGRLLVENCGRNKFFTPFDERSEKVILDTANRVFPILDSTIGRIDRLAQRKVRGVLS